MYYVEEVQSLVFVVNRDKNYFFLDKQPLLCSDGPEATEESIMLQVFNMSERGPVEHSKVPLWQRFSKPIQCTEPPSDLEQALPSCSEFYPERALT